MHKIETKGVAFNGQVGPVRFADGVGYTDHPSMLAHFRRDPDRYAVTEPDEAPEDEGQDPDDGGPEPDPNASEDDGEDGEDGPRHDPEDEDEDEQPDGDRDPYDVGREQLRNMARKRQLSTSGSRPDLQARLRAYDAEHQS